MLLCSVMRGIGLPEELIEDGTLAVSELATNTYLHAQNRGSGGDAELWIWAATRPVPQLVVSVFDTAQVAMPQPGPTDLLDEHGKGLTVVEHLSVTWGADLSRSRLTLSPRAGKRVWFTLALPQHWPEPRPVPPSLASKRLADLLHQRGIATTRTSDAKGISLVTAGHLNIWVEPSAFTWNGGNGHQARHPILDLQDTVEHIVATIDEAGLRPPHPPGGHHHRTPPPQPPLHHQLP